MRVKDQKYNVAIDTACGGKVNFFEGSSNQDGQKDLHVTKINFCANP